MVSLLRFIPVVIFILLLFFLYWLGLRKQSFNQRICWSLGLGIVFGFFLQLASKQSLYYATQAFYLTGSIYLSLLKMVVIPLILTSIIISILKLGNHTGSLLNALAFRSVSMLLIMTALSSAIAIGVGYLFSVGHGLSLPTTMITPKHTYTGFVATILGMIPSNPIAVMANENTVSIVIFAVLVGIAALIVGRQEPSKVETFQKFMLSFFDITKKLTQFIIALTPYAVLSLIAEATSTQGLHTLLGIFNYLGAMYVAMFLVFLMHLFILFISGKNPIDYLKKAYAPLLVAFTTRSSFGTLPVTEETLRDRLNTRQITASFVPSMGATLGMNACAGVFPAMLVVMTLTILHQPMTISMFFIILFINAIASLGISGIPGTAFVAAAVSLTALGLPYAIVGLVQGIDPIIDMGRTAVNVNGALTTAIVVNQSLPE